LLSITLMGDNAPMGRRGKGKLFSSALLTSSGSQMKKLLQKPIMKEIKPVAAKKVIQRAKKTKDPKRNGAPARAIKPIVKKKVEPARKAIAKATAPVVEKKPESKRKSTETLPPKIVDTPPSPAHIDQPPPESAPSTEGQPVTMVAPVGF